MTQSAAGLFLALELPQAIDEEAVLAQSRARGVMLDGHNEHAFAPRPPGIAFGFSGGPEAALQIGVRLFAEATAAAA